MHFTVFEVQRLLSVIGDGEPKTKLAAKGDLVGDEEVVEAE